LIIISAMDDIQRRILPLMETIEKEQPAIWTELGIQVFRQAIARLRKVTTTKPLANLNFDTLVDAHNDGLV
jgi:hypothetical protein